MHLVLIEKSSILRLALMSREDGRPIHTPSLIAAVVELAGFKEFPETIAATENGLEFGHGVINDVVVDKLGVYADGCVLSSRETTERLDHVLAYLADWVSDQFGASLVRSHEIDTLYESNIIVKSDKDLCAVGEAYAKMAKRVGEALKATSGIDAYFTPASVLLSPDMVKVGGLKPAAFSVARKGGADFSSNLYYCVAPLPTTQHLLLLDEISALL